MDIYSSFFNVGLVGIWFLGIQQILAFIPSISHHMRHMLENRPARGTLKTCLESFNIAL